MIEVKDLRKVCKKQVVADHIGFKLVNGAVYGVLELTKQGGSALLALLAGALTPDAGFVRINGFDTVRNALGARRCIGYLPKDLIPYPDMTPEEYLIFIAEARELDYEEGMRRVHELLDEAELRGRKKSLCTHLTSAESKRLCLAQALVGDPEILILDDPTAGLGEREKNDILERIELLSDTKTVILGSSSLATLRTVCDTILVLSEGKLIGIYDESDPALDTVFAALCEANGAQSVPDTVPSHSWRKRKRTKRPTYTPPKKSGEYELIDDSDESNES